MLNDSALITGLSSAQSRRLAHKAEEQSKAKQSKGAQLKPHAEMILQWIADEKSNCTNIEKLILDVQNQTNLQAQVIAIQMHLDFLNTLNSRAKRLLRAESRDV